MNLHSRLKMENEIRSKYDSLVVYLYNTRRENLLPKHFRATIPYTTISNWRKTNYDSFKGSEYREMFEEAFVNAGLQEEHRPMKSMLRTTLRSCLLLRALLAPVLRRSGSNKDFQPTILKAIDVLRTQTGTTQALKLLGISQSQYSEWLLESRFDCLGSYTSLCTKRHPHQLQLSEVMKIKKMLTSPELDHWPIYSIASQGLRKGKIIASLGTWYKYARLLGITKKPIKGNRKKVGLQATCPNEYLHVDTTEFGLIVGQLVFITFVQDNFSKKILGFSTSDRLSFEQVKEALRRALLVIAKHPDQRDTTLVADGGSENHHHKVNEFLANLSGQKVTKVRALKDIRFSNSPVEAIHKIMKSRYLRRKQFMNREEIERYLEWAVDDYNNRPHYKHMPRTPFEAYFNIPLKFNPKQRLRSASKRRVCANKCSHCTVCQSNRPLLNRVTTKKTYLTR